MRKYFSPRLLALLEALLVTFLWSTSYIIIKNHLAFIPPLTFAAYRYICASLILLIAFKIFSKDSKGIGLSTRHLKFYLIAGFFGFTVAQGLQFVGLIFLHATAVSLILSYTPIMVLILGIIFLKEKASIIQMVGMFIALAGALFFFSKELVSLSLSLEGFLITIVSGFGWALYIVLVRYYLKVIKIPIFKLTVYSMVFGSIMLLILAYVVEREFSLMLNVWGAIIWLAVVNTAFAFLLWNNALRILRAYEQSVLQNTMLIQIAVLAWLFLNEPLFFEKILGISFVFLGVLLVQLRKI